MHVHGRIFPHPEPNPDPYKKIVKDPDERGPKLRLGSGKRSFTVVGLIGFTDRKILLAS
jgi:hypothetical protein